MNSNQNTQAVSQLYANQFKSSTVVDDNHQDNSYHSEHDVVQYTIVDRLLGIALCMFSAMVVVVTINLFLS